MKTDKTSILISIIDMNLYSLKKFIYGSGYEQILSSGLKELPIEIDLLIKNHKDTKFNSRFDISDAKIIVPKIKTTNDEINSGIITYENLEEHKKDMDFAEFVRYMKSKKLV
jgi:hypothetical protein